MIVSIDGVRFDVQRVNVPQHGMVYRVREVDGWGDLADTWLFRTDGTWVETISHRRTIPVAWTAGLALQAVLRSC